ncbi:DNA-directed RNA polymerase subunit alpha [Candidatus Woesebacteria bacterium RIFOXYA1_FULL_40_18]|nr:MAG: DNA-directed RNA polymerase subunit alpha [Candidatus Woesebacteria bacterium RIFOXYA1_FULL_40_18]OGM80425.1 MAG: DNA-directed RNA polymerase subunit alpha [Candidatus Woesebacteria bacterium RIFOXYB1_FULL_40_26]OGM87296.1 MAG: DNA-directed RNA polymerase subunit alpha [Candidatus Woesebacteria bacterium RIFOXYD1_FULL_40_21]
MFEVKQEKTSTNYAKYIISPLEQGYGDTLGNSLRRVLLTSLAGAGVVSVKIAGVKHQFSTLSGMKEDVVEFILNLKKVRFSTQSFLEKPIKGKISIKEAGEVKAKDIILPAGVKVANPELILVTLSKGAKLEAETEIVGGVGYSPSEDRTSGTIGQIPMDASFSPVVRVNYKVEETRVGRFTNYDKLTLEVWTDGTISPKDALFSSAKILVSYFNQVISPKKRAKEAQKEEVDTLGAVGKLSVEEIGLPTRVANALGKAGYETVSDLIKAKKEDLVKVRNLGEKSIKIISIALAQKGVKFGE